MTAPAGCSSPSPCANVHRSLNGHAPPLWKWAHRVVLNKSVRRGRFCKTKRRHSFSFFLCLHLWRGKTDRSKAHGWCICGHLIEAPFLLLKLFFAMRKGASFSKWALSSIIHPVLANGGLVRSCPEARLGEKGTGIHYVNHFLTCLGGGAAN